MFDDRQQLNRMESKIDHAHLMLHAIADGIAALASASADNEKLAQASVALNKKTAEVKKKLESFVSKPNSPEPGGSMPASNPTVDGAIAAMQQALTVEDGVLTFVNTEIPILIQAAVDKALAGGATAEQLSGFTQLNTDLPAKSAAVVAALLANTPVTSAQLKAKK